MPVADIIEKTRTPEGGGATASTYHAQSRHPASDERAVAEESRPVPTLSSGIHDPEAQYRLLAAKTKLDRDNVSFAGSLFGLVMGVARAL